MKYLFVLLILLCSCGALDLGNEPEEVEAYLSAAYPPVIIVMKTEMIEHGSKVMLIDGQGDYKIFWATIFKNAKVGDTLKKIDYPDTSYYK